MAVTTTSRSEPGLRARLRLALALLLACALAACSSCGKDEQAPAPGASAAVDLSPVPEPEGLVAELFVAKPDQTWKRIRALAGGPVNLLPANYPVLVTTLLGLPPTSAGAFDADVASVGAVVSPAPDQLAVVLGIHVKSGRELIAALTTGNDPRFAAKMDAASGVTLLEPKRGAVDMALGMVGNHLIAAQTEDHLKRFGPFVARTLPKRELPAEGIVANVPKKALSGPLAKKVRARWKAFSTELEQQDRKNREQRGGRAPDFGDPLVALRGVGAAVEGIAKALESSRHGRLVVLPRDDRLEARLELETEPGGDAARALEQMAVGDLAPLLALPLGMDAVVVNRTTAAGREESARSLAEGAASLFGDRLKAADKKKLEQVALDLAAGRGDVASYGLLAKNERTTLVYRGTVADEKRFAQGVRGLLELAKVPALAEPVRQFVGDVSVTQSTAQVPGVDAKVQRARIKIEPSPMRKVQAGGRIQVGPKELELLWFVENGVAYLALSSDPAAALVDLATASGDGTLAGDASSRGSVQRIGAGSSFALYAQPSRLGIGTSRKTSTPLLVTLGKSNATGWVRLDADRAAVQALVSRFARF